MVKDFIPAGGAADPVPNNTFKDFTGSSAAYLASQAAAATITSAFTPTYSGQTVFADASAAAFTITLPTAVGNNGFWFRIKKVDSTLNEITVATNASQTIDGSTANKLIRVQYESMTFVSDNSNWFVADGFKRVS